MDSIQSEETRDAQDDTVNISGEGEAQPTPTTPMDLDLIHDTPEPLETTLYPNSPQLTPFIPPLRIPEEDTPRRPPGAIMIPDAENLPSFATEPQSPASNRQSVYPGGNVFGTPYNPFTNKPPTPVVGYTTTPSSYTPPPGNLPPQASTNFGHTPSFYFSPPGYFPSQTPYPSLRSSQLPDTGSLSDYTGFPTAGGGPSFSSSFSGPPVTSSPIIPDSIFQILPDNNLPLGFTPATPSNPDLATETADPSKFTPLTTPHYGIPYIPSVPYYAATPWASAPRSLPNQSPASNYWAYDNTFRNSSQAQYVPFYPYYDGPVFPHVIPRPGETPIPDSSYMPDRELWNATPFIPPRSIANSDSREQYPSWPHLEPTGRGPLSIPVGSPLSLMPPPGFVPVPSELNHLSSTIPRTSSPVPSSLSWTSVQPKHGSRRHDVVFNPDIESFEDEELEPDITPEAPLWKNYAEEALQQDKENITNWNQSMDVMLVFAGLFSAILTAFIIEFYKLLQQDPQQTTVELLVNITETLQAVAANQLPFSGNSSANALEDFALPLSVLWVNGLWFTSLACSLGSAMAAMVIKQWLQYYALNLSGGSQYDYAQRRQYRYNALQRWHVPGIISALPLAMHISVGLFLVGLVVQLWQINSTIAILACTLIGAFLSCYTVTLLMPLVYSACPYKSSFLVLIQEGLHYFYVNALRFLHHALLLAAKEWPDWAKHMPLHIVQSLHTAAHDYGPRKAESDDISRLQPDLDIDGIVWLLEVSQKPDVANLSLRSLQELQHTNNMIQQLLDNDIMDQLAQKANVKLPPRDSDFWEEKLKLVEPHHAIFRKLAVATDFMRSLMFVWHHPLYSSHKRPPVLSEQGHHSAYTPLFGDWLHLWRALKSLHNNDPLKLGQQGWDLNSFVVMICAEAHHYHLHPGCEPLHVLDLDSIYGESPFIELVQLLKCACITESLDYLPNETVRLMLDTLGQALSSMKTAGHVFARQDILEILLQLMISRYMTYDSLPVLQKLLTCLQMFDLNLGLERTLLAQSNYGDLSKKDLLAIYCQTYSIISQHCLTSQSMLLNINVESILQLALHLLYHTLHLQNAPSGVHDHIFVLLPATNASSFLEKILAAKPIQFKTVHSVEWFVSLLCKWYLHGHLTTEHKHDIVDLVIELLGYNWPGTDLKTVAAHAIPFITGLIMGSDILVSNTVSLSLCNVIQRDLQRHDHQLLGHFVQMQALDKVLDFLQSKSRTHDSGRAWAQLAEIWSTMQDIESPELQLASIRLYNVAVIVQPDELEEETDDETEEDEEDEEEEEEEEEDRYIEELLSLEILSPISEGQEALVSSALIQQDLPGTTEHNAQVISSSQEYLELFSDHLATTPSTHSIPPLGDSHHYNLIDPLAAEYDMALFDSPTGNFEVLSEDILTADPEPLLMASSGNGSPSGTLTDGQYAGSSNDGSHTSLPVEPINGSDSDSSSGYQMVLISPSPINSSSQVTLSFITADFSSVLQAGSDTVDVHPAENQHGELDWPTPHPIEPPHISGFDLPPEEPIVCSYHGSFSDFTHWSEHRLLYQNVIYPSAYHLLEALKFLEHRPDLAEHIRSGRDMQDVHTLASMLEEHVRKDWDDIVLTKVEEVLYLKFKQHPDLCRQLLQTNPTRIVYVEGDDEYWGEGPSGNGANEFGKALMRVRMRLQEE